MARAVLFKPSDLENWRVLLKELQVEGTFGIFLMVAEDTWFDYEMLQPLFRELEIPIFGGIFPGVIYEEVSYTEGVVGCSIDQPILLDIVQSINDFSGFPGETVASNDSVLILVDGRTGNIGRFLNNIFETSGSRRGFIGGGAGSLKEQHKRVLFSHDESLENGAIIIRMKGSIGVGVSHGWEPMVGPLVVNGVKGNEITEINWQRAFPYYRQILLEQEQVGLEKENFFNVAKNYPFGMVKMDGSIIVRDAFQVSEDGSIRLLGEVPENSIIVLLQGDKAELIKATEDAIKQAFRRYRELTEKRGGHVLLVDCFSRALFLGGDFKEELKAIREHIPSDIPLFGFLSFGEIASNGERYLEFYNKTTVVGVLG